MKNQTSQLYPKKLQSIALLLLVLMVAMSSGCKGTSGQDGSPQNEGAEITEQQVVPSIPPDDNASEIASNQTPDEIDEFSRTEIEKMASSGETNQDIIPELSFWDKVSQDGSFAAFQKALKAAKSDEDRWKIADKYPEIAKRSGMIDALPPRKDSTQVGDK